MTTTTGRGLPVTGPTLIFTENGKYAYAFSGLVLTEDGALTATALEFTTGKKPIKGLFPWATDFDQLSAGATYMITIYLNDITVYRFRSKNEAGRAQSDWDPIPFFIPPLTTVKVDVNTSSTANVNWTINFMGKTV